MIFIFFTKHSIFCYKTLKSDEIFFTIFYESKLPNQDKYAFDPSLHKIMLFSIISHKYIISKKSKCAGDAMSDLSQSA